MLIMSCVAYVCLCMVCNAGYSMNAGHGVIISFTTYLSIAAPRAPEPFQTLGLIYDELGDSSKALQVVYR